jgi:hypothetical protein
LEGPNGKTAIGENIIFRVWTMNNNLFHFRA